MISKKIFPLQNNTPLKFVEIRTAVYPAAKLDFMTLNELSYFFPNLTDVLMIDPFPSFTYCSIAHPYKNTVAQDMFSKMGFPTGIYRFIPEKIRKKLTNYFLIKMALEYPKEAKRQEEYYKTVFSLKEFEKKLRAVLKLMHFKMLDFKSPDEMIRTYDLEPSSKNTKKITAPMESTFETIIRTKKSKKVFHVSYRINDFFKESFEEKFDLAIVHIPGENGNLGANPNFWEHTISSLKSKGLIWVDGRIQPLGPGNQNKLDLPRSTTQATLENLGIEFYGGDLSIQREIFKKRYYATPEDDFPVLYSKKKQIEFRKFLNRLVI